MMRGGEKNWEKKKKRIAEPSRIFSQPAILTRWNTASLKKKEEDK